MKKTEQEAARSVFFTHEHVEYFKKFRKNSQIFYGVIQVTVIR